MKSKGDISIIICKRNPNPEDLTLTPLETISPALRIDNTLQSNYSIGAGVDTQFFLGCCPKYT
jgi:hypothetical protein